MTPAQTFINQRGIIFRIERNGCIVSNLKGLPNHEQSTSKAYIGFLPGSDVVVGDWLINPSNERFYVQDTITDYFMGTASQLKAYYQTVSEYNSTSEATNIFNIGTANGSIIGTQANVLLNYNDCLQNIKNQIASTNSPDKEELQQLISLLEMIVNNHVTPQKGLFSKFSDVMERNSWITSAISSTLLGWLMSQIH